MPDDGHKLEFDSGSFRDRSSRVFYHQGRVLRVLSPQAKADWDLLRNAPFYNSVVNSGALIKSQEVADLPLKLPELWASDSVVLEHERIPVISYPYEWSFALLKKAALLHLELLLEAVDDNIISKDGSAYNIQFVGTQPTFIDIGSLTPLTAGDSWRGYGQFCQTLLFPLFMRAYLDLPHAPWLKGNLEGIEAAQMKRMLRGRSRFRSGVLKHVYLQSRLQGYAQSSAHQTSSKLSAELKQAGFSQSLIKNNLTGLHKLVSSLKWQPESSTWLDYTDMGHYSDDDRQVKDSFVRKSLADKPRPLVWDLGANTGTYTKMAARVADYVVACDFDEPALDRLVDELDKEQIKNVLPLVMNLANISSGTGWGGKERLAFEQRSQPSAILCLALIHHVVIGANILLQEFVGWLARVGGDLIIEFVHPNDPMVQTLMSNHEQNYDDYNIQQFEAALDQHYVVINKKVMRSRTMYYARALNQSDS